MDVGEPGTIQAQCPCGEVGLEISGEPLAQLFCHCDDCQVVHGAAYVPVAIFPEGAVRLVRGAPVTWKLRRTPRVSCPRCGTRLYAEQPGFRGVMAHLLPEGMFRPTLHIHCRFARMPVKDDRPHFATVPAAFGGSDERVDW